MKTRYFRLHGGAAGLNDGDCKCDYGGSEFHGILMTSAFKYFVEVTIPTTAPRRSVVSRSVVRNAQGRFQ